ARREGSSGVGAAHSTREAGEPGPRGPWEGKELPRRGAIGGHQVGDFEPQSPVTVTPTDSGAACKTSVGRAGCLWARPDLREAAEVTPPPTRRNSSPPILPRQFTPCLCPEICAT